MSVVGGVGSRVAAAVVGEHVCSYEPEDWLRAQASASLDTAESGVTITIETRVSAGGHMPWALLVGRFEPSTSGGVEIAVGHTGDWSVGEERLCQGPLRRPLVPGLPLEFARGALAGLTGRRRASAPGPDRRERRRL